MIAGRSTPCPLSELIDVVEDRLDGGPLVSDLRSAARVHLAFMREPYLGHILSGRKTIESRFSVNRVMPFNRVGNGDAILFKRSGGPVEAIAFVACAGLYFGHPGPAYFEELWEYSAPLQVDAAFWSTVRNARYATLIWLRNVLAFKPIWIAKAPGDRRPWIILRDQPQCPPFGEAP